MRVPITSQRMALNAAEGKRPLRHSEQSEESAIRAQPVFAGRFFAALRMTSFAFPDLRADYGALPDGSEERLLPGLCNGTPVGTSNRLLSDAITFTG